jgi:hypothetical protein
MCLVNWESDVFLFFVEPLSFLNELCFLSFFSAWLLRFQVQPRAGQG